MTKQMTKAQSALLDTFRRLPARYRVHGRAGAPLRLEVLDSYDARVWRGLFERGLLKFTSNGVAVN